ncbi:MAG: hypothetical protein DSY66_02670 [Persephonella sp.]|nr:MAG: hypothetical protein DSY66_02670 [Persephonella sp.]
MYKGNYIDFLRALGYRESGGRYNIENSYGYLGKYQMGESALKDAGYYKGDPTRRNDWIGEWTGKDGVWSKEDFLNNPRAQENAIREFHRKSWKYIRLLGLDKYVGKRIGGILITESGLLGGAHLLGAGNVKKFLKSNGRYIPRDGYGTPITEYIKKFAGYDISEITGNSYYPYEINETTTDESDNNGYVWDMDSSSSYEDGYSDDYQSDEEDYQKEEKEKSIWDLFF